MQATCQIVSVLQKAVHLIFIATPWESPIIIPFLFSDEKVDQGVLTGD